MKRKTTNFIIRTLAVYVGLIVISFLYDFALVESGGNVQYVKFYGVAKWTTLTYAWIVFHNKVLVTQLLLNGKKIYYALLVVPAIAIYAWLFQYAMGEVDMYRGTITSLLVFTIIGTAIYLAWLYIDERSNFFQLSALKRELEIQQLKTQLNPHFLFNSLNNIYSYNLKNDTYGNDLILKLSQLVRFIVESSKLDAIPIKDEISFIENYIAFEKERLGTRCEIKFVKDLSDPERRIPPLILFPFIENAFKHGSNTIRNFLIEISIDQDAKQIRLFTKNVIYPSVSTSTKTGLTNIQRRLELLWPASHTLDIKTKGEYFIVDLVIQGHAN
ncbi:MAG: histidine kinase [Bacteroidota bacterium]